MAKNKIEKLKVKVNSISALLMCNARMANKEDPYKIELDELLSIKDPNEATKDLIIKTQWLGHLYHNEEKTKVVMPSDNFMASGWQGAKKKKKGPSFISAVSMNEPEFPLVYPDSKKIRNLKQLYDLRKYVDKRLVTQNKKSKILRVRPIFRQWSFEAEMLVDTNIFKVEQVLEAFYNAGVLVGIGDFRPSAPAHPGQYGKYTVEVL